MMKMKPLLNGDDFNSENSRVVRLIIFCFCFITFVKLLHVVCISSNEMCKSDYSASDNLVTV